MPRFLYKLRLRIKFIKVHFYSTIQALTTTIESNAVKTTDTNGECSCFPWLPCSHNQYVLCVDFKINTKSKLIITATSFILYKYIIKWNKWIEIVLVNITVCNHVAVTQKTIPTSCNNIHLYNIIVKVCSIAIWRIDWTICCQI